MSSVDKRVVDMEFNNKQFTAASAESVKSLQNVEAALAKTGNSKGLTSLGSAAVDVKQKFSIMEIAGITAVANIANKAVNSATNFVKGFSFGPIMDGFNEYELKMGTIQTIKANTGESLKNVNAELNKLNEYSDKTIYNFGDMTRNIGYFTNSGIKLKAATNMIKGFSNEAAVSGTNAQQAAGAAYQLSQALSNGEVRLMDWKSLTNVGMGNAKMKKGLVDMAEAMGTFTDDTTKSTARSGKFNETLEKGWLTAGVMENYLKMQAGELNKEQLVGLGLSEKRAKEFLKQQKVAADAATKVRTWSQLVGTIKESLGSTYASAFEVVLGNFNSGTKLFTKMNDVADKAISTFSNGLLGSLQSWKKEEGRKNTILAMKNAFKLLEGVVLSVKKAVGDVFPSGGPSGLAAFSRGLKGLTEYLVPTEKTLNSLRDIFGGVFAVLHIGMSVIKGVVAGFGAFFKALMKGAGPAGGGILSLVAAIGRFLKSVDKILTNDGRLSGFFEGIGRAAAKAISPIIGFVGAIGRVIGAIGGVVGGMLSSINWDKVKQPLIQIKDIFMDLLESAENALGKLSQPIESVGDKLSSLAKKFGGGPKTPEPKTAKSSGGSTSSANSIRKESASPLAAAAMSVVPPEAEKNVKKLAKATDGAKNSIAAMYKTTFGGEGVKASDTVDKSAKQAEAAASKWEEISAKLSDGLTKIGGMFSKVGAGITWIFDKLGTTLAWVGDRFQALFAGMNATDLAGLVNLILGAMIMRKLDKGLGTFKGFVEGIKEAAGGIEKVVNDTFGSIQNTLKAVALKQIAIAIGIIVVSMIALAFVPRDKLIQAGAAIAGIFGMLTLMLMTIGKSQGGAKKFAAMAASILTIGQAILMMAGAVYILGSMNPEKLAYGIGALGAMMGILILALTQLGKHGTQLEVTVGAILAMAGAILIMTIAVERLAGLSLAKLAKGLGAVAIMMGLLALSMIAMSKSGVKEMPAVAAALIAMAVAIGVLTNSVLVFSLMDPKKLGQGLAAVFVLILMLTASMAVLATVGGKNALAAAGAMVLLAGAVQILAATVIMLGLIPMKVIATGIIAIAAGLAVLLLAGLLAMKVAPGLAILGATILALGAAVFLAGAGMALFATSLAILVALGAAGIAIMVAAITAFIGLLPSIATQMAASFVAFLKVIGNASGEVRKAVGQIVTAALGAIRDSAKEFGKTVRVLLKELVLVIRNLVPDLVEAAHHIILKFMESIEEKLPDFIDSGGNIIMGFIEGIGSKSVEIADATAKTVIEVLDGLSQSIDDNAEPMRQAAGRLIMSFLNALSGGLAGKIKKIFDDGIRKAVGGLKGIGGFVAKKLGKDGREQAENDNKDLSDLLKKFEAQEDARKRISKSASKTLTNDIEKTTTNILKMMSDINAAVVGGTKAAVQAMQSVLNNTKNALFASYRSEAIDILIQGVKGKGKKADKKRGALERRQANLGRQAERAQTAADRAQERADYQKTLGQTRSDDYSSLGGTHIDYAKTVGDQAVQETMRAKALMKEANGMKNKSGKAYKKLVAQAKKSEQQARALEAQAKAAYASAESAFNKALDKTMTETEKRQSEYNERIAKEEKYKNATDAEKLELMRADANEAKNKADTEWAKYAQAVANAKAAAAAGQNDLAQNYLAQANEAADKAEGYSQESRDLLNQMESLQEQAASSGSSILPSKTALEDAAKSMDRYTQSYIDAQEQSQAQQPISYVQNNYSPESLDAATIYRNSRNLMSKENFKLEAVG